MTGVVRIIGAWELGLQKYVNSKPKSVARFVQVKSKKRKIDKGKKILGEQFGIFFITTTYHYLFTITIF